MGFAEQIIIHEKTRGVDAVGDELVNQLLAERLPLGSAEKQPEFGMGCASLGCQSIQSYLWLTGISQRRFRRRT